jgi:chemotaxis regulatin CheY-phosphate phosphatase CheZ
MIALNAALDPSSVTMTTTNIPDAIAKLAVVVRQMSAASHKVFELVEQQHALRNQLVQLAEQVGQHASMSALSPELAAKLLQEHRSVSDQLDNLGHEIVMAHEFQDLCGQSLYKVTALLEGLSRDLRELLPTLGITPPPPQSSSDNNPDLGQAEMDAIIRQLTTW